MKHKYKVGDRVKVRPDLNIDEHYGNDVFVIQMAPYLNKILIVKELTTFGYILNIPENKNGLGYTFTEEMFDNSFIDVNTLSKLNSLKELVLSDTFHKNEMTLITIDTYISMVKTGNLLQREQMLNCNTIYKRFKKIAEQRTMLLYDDSGMTA
jgi:hypothetical protein